MKNPFGRIMKKYFKRSIAKYLINNKVRIVAMLNQRLDIPNVDEDAEERLLNTIYVSIVDILEDAIEEI